MTMKLCIIPARGGSKRIPGKNIKSFCGKPIIAYSIEAALNSGCFDTVMVSTDDEKIASVARKFGADVPFLRPESLADDHTGTQDVIRHAIQWYLDAGEPVEEVCCVYATAPFLTGPTLAASFEQFRNEEADFCFSVTEFEFPIQRAVKLTPNRRVEMFNPENFSVRSQDLEPAYHDAGQFYWGRTEAFLEQRAIFSSLATPFILPSYLVQDIDTPDDWVRAELMFTALQGASL
jgi:pseudaminic acid cytidylyltransferase